MRKLQLCVLIFFGCSAVSSVEDHFTTSASNQLDENFEMEIILFVASSPCGGGKAYASLCIGKTSIGDTLKVLSLCNEDTSFTGGQVVRVKQTEKPIFHVSVPILLEESHDITPQNANNYREIRTIFGKIEKL